MGVSAWACTCLARPDLEPPVSTREEVKRSEDAKEQLHDPQPGRRDSEPLLQNAAARDHGCDREGVIGDVNRGCDREGGYLQGTRSGTACGLPFYFLCNGTWVAR
jgi:hypothetical protein